MMKKLFAALAAPSPDESRETGFAALPAMPASLVSDSPYGIADLGPANAVLHSKAGDSVRSCYAWIEEDDEGDRMRAAVKYRVDPDALIWIEDKRVAWAYHVESLVDFEGWSRLTLEPCHVERRSRVRRPTDIDARLVWRSEETSGDAAASIQNLSSSGAQVYTSGELPIGATVELEYDDMQRVGTVQWSSVSAVGCVSGLLFLDPAAGPPAEPEHRPTLGDQLRDLRI